MSDPLELEVRKKIYDTIVKYPGIHLRELQRKTELATGSLDYHIHLLHKRGMIRVEKDQRFTRYYSAQQPFSSSDKQVMSLLRQETIRHILVYVLQRNQATAMDIAQACKIQPSNLSNYLKTLEANDILAHTKQGRYRFYAVKDKETVIRLMATHKKSFLDSLVDNFIDVWAENS